MIITSSTSKYTLSTVVTESKITTTIVKTTQTSQIEGRCWNLDGVPSDLVLTVDSYEQISGEFVINSTNHIGHKVYISDDNITFTLLTTLTGSQNSFVASGLTPDTIYYFKVVAYKVDITSPFELTGNAQTEAVQPITINSITVAWDNINDEFDITVDATGGTGVYTVTYTQNLNILNVVVTDTIGTTANQNVNLDDISPIVIDSATYEVIDNVAHVTIVAIGGFGDLTYQLGAQTNSTGIFTVSEADTYTIEVSDEGGSTPAADSIIVDIFPPLKDDVLIYIDGVETAGQLIDLSGNNNNVVVTDNLLTNPSCELDFGWNTWTGGTAPLLNERSTEQVHAGTYSRKINLSGLQGVQSLPYFTRTGDVVNYSFWIRSYAGTATIRYIIRNGIDNANIVSVSLGNPAQNTWINVTGSYTETAGGVNAKVVVYLTSGARNFYIDDFSIVSTGIKNIILPLNPTISNALITKTPYYSSGNPLTVRVDGIATNQNDQVFFKNDGLNYKMLIYNQAVDGKSLNNILTWLGGTYTFLQHLTTEKTIVTPIAERHRGFHHSTFLGNRWYLIYKDGTMHTSIDGTSELIYSDDFGKTWSSPETVYDASEILAENPQILIDDPIATAGTGSGNFLQVSDSEMLIFVMAVAGHMKAPEDSVPPDPLNVCIRITHSYYTKVMRVPIVNGVLDFANKVLQLLPFGMEIIGGYAIKKDNVIYIPTYSPNVYLWVSTDNGVTFQKRATVFSSSNINGNEATIYFIGERLYMVIRGIGYESAVAYSDDYGYTWQNRTSLIPRLDGLSSLLTSDGGAIIYGRNVQLGNQIMSLIKLKNETFGTINNLKATSSPTEDIGYGKILVKNGIAFITYHDGALSAYPNKYNHADAGVYFKMIDANYLDKIT